MLETTRQCNNCQTIKNISEFYRNITNKGDIRPTCKMCDNAQTMKYGRSKRGKIVAMKYRRSKHGKIVAIYATQKASSKRREHNPPTYSRQELEDWLFSQKKFHLLYDNWKRLDFQKMYAPSVDRKDDSIGYTMSNIQLMTWVENDTKGRKDKRNPVSQYTKTGNLVEVFESAYSAANKVGGTPSNIRQCCLNKLKTSVGFVWKFS